MLLACCEGLYVLNCSPVWWQAQLLMQAQSGAWKGYNRETAVVMKIRY